MFVLLVACAVLGAEQLGAQSQTPAPNQPAQNQPVQQKPAQQEPNAFPEDTNSVPVLPSTNAAAADAAAPDATGSADYSNVTLASPDEDPVRSPDDAPLAADTTGAGASSSDAGLGQILKPPPDEEKTGRHRHGGDDGDAAPHEETAKEDESVGGYYLDQKNWHAALSRYESAVVLDPENPDVYWGLAEAERHLGDFAAAKTHYMKVMVYDPDSKHSKEAKKFLAEPEIANARAVSANTVAPQQ
jgi:tetratricopeptide (TPR) repeat protein